MPPCTFLLPFLKPSHLRPFVILNSICSFVSNPNVLLHVFLKPGFFRHLHPDWMQTASASYWSLSRKTNISAGSVSSLWQQAGRAGRREQASLSIYIAFDGPLDQYFMHNPRALFDRSIEKAQVLHCFTDLYITQSTYQRSLDTVSKINRWTRPTWRSCSSTSCARPRSGPSTWWTTSTSLGPRCPPPRLISWASVRSCACIPKATCQNANSSMCKLHDAYVFT